jgi:hypothetical protein
MELIRFKKIITQPYWFYVKAVFVICGTGIGYATFLSGYILRDDYKLESIVKVIDTHMWFAVGTLVIFNLLSLGYILDWLERGEILSAVSSSSVVRFFVGIKKILHSNLFCVVGAILGFVGIMITGALGGALAHGRDVDPVVDFIYGMLIGK